MIRALCAASALFAIGGCGLVDSDITDFDLSLPEREVTVDTVDWMLSDMDMLPAVDCSDDAQICGTAVGEYCSAEDVCSGACGQSTETCEVHVGVALWHTFHLSTERPELEQIEGQPLVSVSVKRVYYTISENTLDVDSPPLTVYIGPEGTMAPGDTGAQAIGTIAPVPAGQTVADADVELTDTGRDILAEFMKDYQTPFNLVVGADVVLEAGDDLPTGKLVATVGATATAGL